MWAEYVDTSVMRKADGGGEFCRLWLEEVFELARNRYGFAGPAIRLLLFEESFRELEARADCILLTAWLER